MKKTTEIATDLYSTLDLKGLERYVTRVSESYKTDLKYGRSGQTNKRYMEAGIIALKAKRNTDKRSSSR